jgi:prepilin-type N-terminal cleavage/methylation domain-containing protein
MKKGFTLIELAVVLLVIGILAGIILRNISGQTPMARDTRRVADLRNTSAYLATYLSKFGQFPTSSSWDALETALRNAGITDRLPRDPSTGQGYSYFHCSDLGSPSTNPVNHFILGATLEQTPTTAPRLWETAVAGIPTGWQCNSSNVPCTPASRQYCIAQ